MVSSSWWTSHFERVLAAQEARIRTLQQRVRRRGTRDYEQLATLPRGSADYLLVQSVDLLEKGHQLCKQTLRQIELSRERLNKERTPPPRLLREKRKG